MSVAPSRRRIQFAWALNDWANSAFATTVLVGFFPIFFKQFWATDLSPTDATLYLGFGNSSASLMVMLMSPWLGAVADRLGAKKRFLGVFTVLGALSTFVLAFIGAGDWELAIVVFVLASVGFFGSLTFNDALLVSVATREESDRVSAWGYGLGYLGGGLLFLVNVMMVLKPEWFGLADKVAATRAAFISVALWWILFSIPLFRHVPETRVPSDAPLGWREIWATVRQIAQHPPVWKFLLAYFLYIDAVGTLAQMAVDFGLNLGFKSDSLIKALLLVQFVSFPAAIGFGYLADRIGTKRAIYLALCVYIGVTCWGYFMQTESQFYQMAAAIGLVQGGVQSLSRSYFSRLIPEGQAGQFFGFYNMLGKFAAVLGPSVVGIVAASTGNPRLSILALIAFFIGGILLLARVREPRAS
ncbi:MFS transporter [Nevskia sp.]|uniref:MFS transporter n=1 Tax=Nevskia sp. TaxID=1929292 RepID=UPI0025DA4EA9|nr:MFS transporter [Nevskia sp.]